MALLTRDTDEAGGINEAEAKFPTDWPAVILK